MGNVAVFYRYKEEGNWIFSNIQTEHITFQKERFLDRYPKAVVLYIDLDKLWQAGKEDAEIDRIRTLLHGNPWDLSSDKEEATPRGQYCSKDTTRGDSFSGQY